jgi:hypothetical protein
MFGPEYAPARLHRRSILAARIPRFTAQRGSTETGLRVTVLGHTMTTLEEVAVVGALTLLLAADVWAFGRQEYTSER